MLKTIKHKQLNYNNMIPILTDTDRIMRLILTDTDKRKLLTKSLQYLIDSLIDWNFELDFSRTQYRTSKQALEKNGFPHPYIQDVFCEMVLSGFNLKFIDLDSTENIIKFNIDLLNENLDNCDPMDVIAIINDGDYNFYTTDRILQTLVFGETIYR